MQPSGAEEERGSLLEEHEVSTSQLESRQIEKHAISKPLFVYPLLAAAILSVSSSPVLMYTMSEIPPFLLASWRLQITAALLLPAGAYTAWCMTADERHRLQRHGLLIVASGLLLGAHFGSWLTCLENTSLTHSLLVASTPPIIIALWTWIMRKPISAGELLGTATAAVGCVLVAQSAGHERQVSIYGDAVGIVSAAVFVIYLSIGRHVRSWMPLSTYVAPVNLLAALFLCCAAVATEGAGFDRSQHGLFGYLGSWTYLWKAAYLGAVPGIAGHVSFNALLRWLHPLLIALAGTTEAPIGTMIGLAVGVGSVPGIFTYLGGSILLSSAVLVNVSSYKREKAKAAAATDVSLGEMSAVVLSIFPIDAAVDAAERGGDHEEAEIQDLLATRKSSDWPSQQEQ